MDIKKIRLENLLSILAKPGIKQASLAEACDTSASVISQIKTGHRGIGDDLARRIEEAQKLPYGWMDSRHLDETGFDDSQAIRFSRRNPDSDNLGIQSEDLESDFIQVPVYNVHLSAGNGMRVDHEQIVERLPISRKYLADSGVPENQATIVEVKGDSMEYTLIDGDVVLVNTAIVKPVSGKIFAFDFDGDLRVKRFIKRLDGSWRIVSDNEDKNIYADESLSAHNIDQLRMIGQVVTIVKRKL